jgi:hypothetical protein
MVTRIDNITDLPNIQRTGTTVRLEEANVDSIVRLHLEALNVDRRYPEGSEIKEFFELVQSAVVSRQNSEGVPEDKRVLCIADDPPEAIDTEAITFYVKARVPGKVDQGSAGAGRIKEVTAHVRSVRQHPDHPAEKLITMGRFYDNWVTFTVYAKTDKVALARMLWFEKTMDIYSWLFRLYGFRVVEQGVGDRDRFKIDETTVTTYPMSYMVRTDDTFHYGTQELRDVLLNVSVLSRSE